jgi:hypothetical protein
VNPHRIICYVLTAALGGAAVCMILGAWDRDHPALYRLSLGVALLAGVGLTLMRTRDNQQVLERVRQEGYDAGYSDGCDVSRPARIALLPTGSDGATLPFRSSPQ